MIVLKLSGGIGNQMFQYAFGRYISSKHKTSLVFDLSFYESQNLRKFDLDVFNLKIKTTSKNMLSLFVLPANPSFLNKLIYKTSRIVYRSSVEEEKHFTFYPEALQLPSNSYIDGYWQSEKYFLEIKDLIRNDFSFKFPMDLKNEKMFELISNTNSISMHIRRGDYVSNAVTNNVHGTCDLSYYLSAIEYINSNVVDSVFFIFSDDIEWVKKSIKIDNVCHFVDFNSSDKSYEDMRLMSLCKHNIIANSSFSWWGAWLNNNPDKIVIAPQKWFNESSKDTADLIPDSWIKI